MIKIFGLFFLDLTKLIFAGVIIGAIMRENIAFNLLLLRGIAAMLLTVSAAFIFLYVDNHLKNK